MKQNNKFLAIITLLIVISWIFPDFWQVVITGIISFFLAYLTTKINQSKQKRN